MKNFSKMRQGLSCVVMAFLLMLIPAGVFAQNSISVSGIVMDDTNEPVIGAAVMVKGTTIGVITDNTTPRIGDGCRFCRQRAGYDKDQERKSAEYADRTYSWFARMAEEF